MSRCPFHRRSTLVTLVACFAVSFVGISRLPAESITYNLLPVTSLNGYTLSGAITTDGVTGNLSPQDILAWNWTMTSGTNTVSDSGITLSSFPSAGLGASQTALYLQYPDTPSSDYLTSTLRLSPAEVPYCEFTTFAYAHNSIYSPLLYSTEVMWRPTYEWYLHHYSYTYSPPPGVFTIATTIPEPSTLALLCIGALGLLAYGWRRRRLASRYIALGAAAVVVFAVGVAQAVTIDMVPVGNAGNGNDSTGYGGVASAYLIGKYEVTNAQWREFLTAKAGVSDPYGLYNTSMAGIDGGIGRTWSVDHYVYSAKGGDTNWDNRPVNYVSFWDTARFCNWLHNGQGSGDTETGAYALYGYNGSDGRQIIKNPAANYWIPSENEWYKAAYHDKTAGLAASYFDYPTNTNDVPSNVLSSPDPGNNANFYYQLSHYTIGSPYWTTPVGEFENSESPYGTFDQGGNLFEWNDARIYPSPLVVLRGGSWGYDSSGMLASNRDTYSFPTDERNYYGFRVASVPEPGSIALAISGAVGLLFFGWRRRKRTAQGVARSGEVGVRPAKPPCQVDSSRY